MEKQSIAPIDVENLHLESSLEQVKPFLRKKREFETEPTGDFSDLNKQQAMQNLRTEKMQVDRNLETSEISLHTIDNGKLISYNLSSSLLLPLEGPDYWPFVAGPLSCHLGNKLFVSSQSSIHKFVNSTTHDILFYIDVLSKPSFLAKSGDFDYVVS